jgi:hypothetical protein
MNFFLPFKPMMIMIIAVHYMSDLPKGFIDGQETIRCDDARGEPLTFSYNFSEHDEPSICLREREDEDERGFIDIDMDLRQHPLFPYTKEIKNEYDSVSRTYTEKETWAYSCLLCKARFSTWNQFAAHVNTERYKCLLKNEEKQPMCLVCAAKGKDVVVTMQNIAFHFWHEHNRVYQAFLIENIFRYDILHTVVTCATLARVYGSLRPLRMLSMKISNEERSDDTICKNCWLGLKGNTHKNECTEIDGEIQDGLKCLYSECVCSLFFN